MAKKRQRKKQQIKQNIQLLNKAGITDKKQVKSLKNDTKAIKKIERNVKRKTVAAERSQLIRSLGFKLSDHGSKRYWSEERFNEWYKSEIKKQQQREKRLLKKAADNNDLYLLMFWRDKTAEGWADNDLIKRYKYNYRHLDDATLIESILYSVTTQKLQGAEIGTTHTVVIKGSQRQDYINFMTNISSSSFSMMDSNDWVLVYEGKAKRYHDVLLAIHAIVRQLYDASERASFIGGLLDKHLSQINRKMAVRLAKDLKWGSF